jgi:tetratricopeptide (TPR) repeat protein
MTALRRQARDLSLVGKYRKAAQLYEELLQRSPHDAQAALHLAELRRRIGDPSGARSAYQQAIALYLHAGWDEKALAVEAALERLTDVTAAPRVQFRAVVGRLTAWLAARFSRTT